MENKNKNIVSAEEAAQRLGISVSQVEELQRRGILHATVSSDKTLSYPVAEIADIQSNHGTSLSQEAAKIGIQIQRETVASLSFVRKLVLAAGGGFLCFLILVAAFSVLFSVFPLQTANWLGLISKTSDDLSFLPNNQAGDGQVLAAHTSSLPIKQPSLLQTALGPVRAVSLGIVRVVSPQAYSQVAKETILDTNDVLAVNNGVITPVIPLKISGGSSLEIANSGLIANLNSEYLQGKKPGTNVGDIAIVGPNPATVATPINTIVREITNTIAPAAELPANGLFTSVNGLAIVNNGSNKLAISSGKTLASNNSLTLAGPDDTTITFQGTDTYVGRATSDILINKTLAAGSNTISGLSNANLNGAAGISNANLANSAITIVGGSGIGLSAGTVSLGGSLTISSTLTTGITSLTGTANQVLVSSPSGAPTLSLPQDIALGSSPTFAALNLTSTSNQLVLGAINTGTLSWSPTTARTLTLPDATDTVVGRATLDTLTNKTIVAGSNTISGLGASNLTAGDFSSKITSGTYSINISGSAASVTDFSGSLSGDVTGLQGSTVVGKINGAALGTTTATSGNLLIGSGTQWATQALSGDATITSGGLLSLKNTGTSGTYGSATVVPVLTTDLQGRVSGVINTTISGLTNASLSGSAGITNANLASSSLSVTAGLGLGAGGLVSLGGAITLDIGEGDGISVNANDIDVNLTTSGTTGLTASNSGLEVSVSGLALLKGCADNEILKWTDAGGWACATDQSGGTTTLQNAYDSGNTVTTTSGRNLAFTLGSGLATPTSLTLTNSGTSDAFVLTNTTSAANGLLINQTTGGTLTSGLNITRSAGTIVSGIVFNGTIGTDITTAATRALTIDSGTTGGISIGTGTDAKTITIGNITGTTGLNFDSGSGGINFGDNANSKTIDIGGVTNSGTDSVNIATNATAADTLAIGNSNASTTVAITGGDDWSISAAGTANFTKTTGSGLANCVGANQKLQWASATNTFSCVNENVLQTRSFNDPADITWADDNTTELFTTPSSRANITPTASANSILVMVSVAVSTGGATDSEAVGVTRRAIGSTATCSSGIVDSNYGTFHSESGADAVATTVFLDSPATTSNVSYTLCTTTDSVLGSTQTKTDATITLIEVSNSTADLAEIYSTNDKTIAMGDVVSLDPSLKSGVRKSRGAYDKQVLGIVSTAPAMVIGGTDGEGVSAVPVALSGRVPVKVNTENGAVKAGDELTSSSIPGVAMRATKAGAIIGSAMSGYSGEGLGVVLAYVKNGSSLGSSLNELMSGAPAGPLNYGKNVLLQLLSNPSYLISEPVDLSNITADTLVAGLEIITPKLTTQDILATGIFSMVNGAGLETVKINASGDATFSGTLMADTIKAKRIEGLELFTNKLSSLTEEVAGLASGPSQPTIADSALKTNIIDQITGALADLFKKTAEFFGNVIFRGDVTFVGRPTFNEDTAGYASLKAGESEVSVNFDKEYVSNPVVTASVTLAGTDKADEVPPFAIYDPTAKGFKIKLSKPASFDLAFSWIALSVSGDESPPVTQPAP